MDISLLNIRIAFQKNGVVVDAIGNRIPTWVDFYSCSATASGEGGTETIAAGNTIESSDISFTVRECRAIKSITTTGFRIRFNEADYDILSIDHMNYKRKAVKFRCRKVRD